MPDNVLMKRRGSMPVRYVDNYDAMSDRLHPRTRAMMDPMVDALERSQIMRGARRTSDDEFHETNVLGDIEDAATSVGWKPQGRGRADMAAMLQAASQSDMGATDGGIEMIVRAAKTYGLPNPFGDQPQGRGTGEDYVFGNRRPQNLQRNSETSSVENDGPIPYRVMPRRY